MYSKFMLHVNWNTILVVQANWSKEHIVLSVGIQSLKALTLADRIV